MVIAAVSNMPEFGRESTGDFPVGSKNLLRRTPKDVLSQAKRMLMLVAHLYCLRKTSLRSNGNKKTWSKSEEEYLISRWTETDCHSKHVQPTVGSRTTEENHCSYLSRLYVDISMLRFKGLSFHFTAREPGRQYFVHETVGGQ